MIYRAIPSPDAEADIRSALWWYGQRDIDLPFRFSADLDKTLSHIALYPKRFPFVEHPVRRALMRQFPYAVYFKLSPDVVDVLAVTHQRRLSPWNKP